MKENKLGTKLILMEGLPSTGKSTNAGILTHTEYAHFVSRFPHTQEALERTKREWGQTTAIDLLEIEWNGLESFGDEAYSALKRFDVWNFSLERYTEVALEKWASFAEGVASSDEVIILDSSIFQFQIYTFLLENRPFNELHEFIQTLYKRVEALNPLLIYYYREDVEDTIQYLVEDRGMGFLEQIWRRDRHRPYYCDKELGAEGYKSFLRDYDAYARRLFEMTPFRKIPIEITAGRWGQYLNQVLSELKVPYIHPPQEGAPSGQYYNGELRQYIHIKDNTLVTPTGASKRLMAKKHNEFYLNDLPVIIKFDNDGFTVLGEQTLERWTTNGTVFVRVGG